MGGVLLLLGWGLTLAWVIGWSLAPADRIPLGWSLTPAWAVGWDVIMWSLTPSGVEFDSCLGGV